jgi:hypothetical protein
LLRASNSFANRRMSSLYLAKCATLLKWICFWQTKLCTLLSLAFVHPHTNCTSGSGYAKVIVYSIYAYTTLAFLFKKLYDLTANPIEVITLQTSSIIFRDPVCVCV